MSTTVSRDSPSAPPVGADRPQMAADGQPPRGEGTPPAPRGVWRRLAAWWHRDRTRSHHAQTSKELAGIRTDLATERTMMAADRTLMAWIRTSLALNSFGFTIYKVLQSLQEGGAVLRRDASPRTAGLFLSVMATVAMVTGTIEYWSVLKLLDQRRVRVTMVIGVLMSLLGVALFFGIMLHAL